MADLDDDELLDALGVEVVPLKVSSRTPREERIIAGFEDILRFHQTHGRAPLHGEDCDIFERLYAVRLDQLRKLPEAQSLLAELDSPGLLSGTAVTTTNVDDLDEDALLAELGIGDVPAEQNDITVLRHVRSNTEKRAAEEIADRTRCADFEKFQLRVFDLAKGTSKADRKLIQKAIEEGWCEIKITKKKRSREEIESEIATLKSKLSELEEELNNCK